MLILPEPESLTAPLVPDSNILYHDPASRKHLFYDQAEAPPNLMRVLLGVSFFIEDRGVMLFSDRLYGGSGKEWAPSLIFPVTLTEVTALYWDTALYRFFDGVVEYMNSGGPLARSMIQLLHHKISCTFFRLASFYEERSKQEEAVAGLLRLIMRQIVDAPAYITTGSASYNGSPAICLLYRYFLMPLRSPRFGVQFAYELLRPHITVEDTTFSASFSVLKNYSNSADGVFLELVKGEDSRPAAAICGLIGDLDSSFPVSWRK